MNLLLCFIIGLGKLIFSKGQLLLNHFIRAIPSIIFPNKHNYPIAEPLISTITDSPLFLADTVDSFGKL